MYMDALSYGAKLLKELKKLDDKNLLVEVGRCYRININESSIY